MTNSQACLFAFVALTIGAVFAPSFGGTAFLSILAVGVMYGGYKEEQREQARADRDRQGSLP